MIAAVSWVPKGVAKSVPSVADPPSKEKIDELIKASDLERSGEDSGSEEDDQEMDVDAAKQTGEVSQALAIANALDRSSKVNKSETKFDDIADGLQELDMDNYDDEEDGIELFSTGLGDLYYPSNSMDPYIKDEDILKTWLSNQRMQSLFVHATRMNLVTSRHAIVSWEALQFSLSLSPDTKRQLCMQVWILDETSDGDSNIYVHHEVPLSAFPLCTAWLDCPLKGGEKGNFIAVGSMEPAIEIWDLDIIDEVQPAVVLGGIEEKKEKKKGKKVSIKYKEGSHTDSVLGLAWNKHFRNILASASADKQVKIWDMDAGKCDITMEHHTDKARI